MMNEESLNFQKKIDELTEENINLKHLVEDLKKELDLQGNTYNPNEPVTIQNYYLKKYLSLHTSIYKKRLNKLEEQKTKLQNEYDMITKEEEGMDLIASKNQKFLERIHEIDEQISSLYYELEKKKFAFNDEIKKITQDEQKLMNKIVTFVNTLEEYLYRNNISETLDYINYILKSVVNELSPKTISINTKKQEIINLYDAINNDEQKIKIDIKNLDKEKEDLQKSVQTISLETIDNLLDSLAVELTKVNNSKEELYQLFTMLKEENIHKIQDEIKHLQVLEYEKKAIAEKMDEMMKSLETDLLNVDTVSNIQLNITMEMSKLSSELCELEPKKQAYEEKLAEFHQLESLLEKVTNNIHQLEDYLALYNRAITSSSKYFDIITKFEGLHTNVNLLTQEIENAKIHLEELKEARRVKSFDPYAKATIQKLTEEIKSDEMRIQKYQLELETIQKEINNIASEQKNLKIINVLKDKKIIESKLPFLYEQLKELKTIVLLKHDEVDNLEVHIKRYDDILLKIEELKRELNNM